jgi:D-serine deaminase-like pyridoxal phosphate-dependent protein
MEPKLNIATPTLLLDEIKCRRNIEAMAEKARKYGLHFRPHFKTHQSREIGRWFRDYGVEAITVSSLQMAAYFADDGWRDITVAFPVNIREQERLSALAGRVKLNLVAESVESLEALDRLLQSPVRIFIKTDTGSHRTGLAPGQEPVIDRMLEFMKASGRMEFAGFLGHAGHSYAARSREEIEGVHRQSLQVMQQLRRRYEGRYPALLVSPGDTPTSSTMSDFEGVDEIRPGNFVFYDVMQIQIGSCSPDQVAVALACPVVALHPGRGEIVLYGGGVHLSKDRSQLPDGRDFFGYVVEWEDNGWRLPEAPAFLRSLSQEHGIVVATPEMMKKVKVGDLLGVLPVHSCMTANLMKGYLTLEGKHIEMMI